MAKNVSERLGKRIRALRRARGWTQDYLAAHSGLGRPFISNVENGKKELCLRAIETLADSFGITLSEFFSRV